MYGVCIGFCLLTACVAFFIATLMAGQSLATFTIPAIEHNWDLQQKAAGCRNAGFLYLLLAIALTAKAFFFPDLNKSSPESRAQYSYGVEGGYSQKEISPLISGSRRTDEPDEDFVVVEREGHSARRQIVTTGGGAYGSVEMQSVA